MRKMSTPQFAFAIDHGILTCLISLEKWVTVVGTNYPFTVT